MEVRLVKTEKEVESISSTMLELRQDYTLDTLVKQINRQREHGYQLAYIESDGKVCCVSGFVIQEKLAWRKHIYIDDLVTTSDSRSKGFGKKMLDWFKQYAQKNDCYAIHLDSGVVRFDAHKFYLQQGFHIASHHFSFKDIVF